MDFEAINKPKFQQEFVLLAPPGVSDIGPRLGPNNVTTQLILPLKDWPQHDLARWKEALLGERELDSDSAASAWRPRTVKKVADGYGRYLSWLMRQGLLLPNELPHERITPERVRAYLGCLKDTLAPVSVGIMAGSLAAAANAFDPEANWSWLTLRYSRLKNRAKPSRKKHQVMQPTSEIYKLGLSHADKAEASKVPLIRKAVKYQQGLIIALLAARPLRIRNFQAISIGTSLRFDGKSYWLTFSGEETKTGRAIDEPVPTSIIPYLEQYLRVHRPILLREGTKTSQTLTTNRLWINRSGRKMEEAALRCIVETVTKDAFGIAIWPHLFRDCLFTSLAVEQPELVQIGSALLNHGSLATGQKHYNQAKMLQASRSYTASILELRTSFIEEILAAQAEPKD